MNRAAATGYEDRELIKMFVAGDNQSFEHLIRRHKSRIYASINLIVRNRELADDLYQETLIKILDMMKTGRYHEEGKFLPWALRVARNLAIDHFRREKKMQFVSTSAQEVSADAALQTNDGLEQLFFKKENKVLVRSLIEKLPHNQREVLILRLYNQMSFKEIADYTGVSINTALGRMRYALVNMRKLMEERHFRAR